MDPLTPSQQLAQIKSLTKLAEKAIGQRIGCSQPTVNRILRGQSDCRGKTRLEIQQWYEELHARKSTPKGRHDKAIAAVPQTEGA